MICTCAVGLAVLGSWGQSFVTNAAVRVIPTGGTVCVLFVPAAQVEPS